MYTVYVINDMIISIHDEYIYIMHIIAYPCAVPHKPGAILVQRDFRTWYSARD